MDYMNSAQRLDKVVHALRQTGKGAPLYTITITGNVGITSKISKTELDLYDVCWTDVAEILTLRRKTLDGWEATPFWWHTAQPNTFNFPAGALYDCEVRKRLARVMHSAEIVNARSMGESLPENIGLPNITFGVAPFPEGQPKFIDDIVAGAKGNSFGGLALAPTRSGKSLCSTAAAIKLGRKTLILVDRTALARQWQEVIENNVKVNGDQPVKCGIIQEDRLEIGPEYPFVVAMIQSLSRGRITDEVKKVFGTLLVDEAHGVPADQLSGCLAKLNAAYTIGLTATPSRGDLLDRAIYWLCGPVIAELARKLSAKVRITRVPFRPAPRVNKKGVAMRPRLFRFNGTMDMVAMERAIMSDPAYIPFVADKAVEHKRNGKRVLIQVGLLDHVAALEEAINERGESVGKFIGGQTTKESMQPPIVLSTYKACEKGIDFQPPPTVLILAGPKGNIAQAAGRVLQPQAPETPIIEDIVVDHAIFGRLAKRRLDYYRMKGFTFE